MKIRPIKILVLNGPNLNLLGTREPEIYGVETLDSIATNLKIFAEKLGKIELTFRQSNAESDLITWIGEAIGHFNGIIINPAALTHTSLGIADAIQAVNQSVPVVETHLSNIHAREAIRRKSLTVSGCIGQIMGFKGYGYILALQALVQTLEEDCPSAR